MSIEAQIVIGLFIGLCSAVSIIAIFQVERLYQQIDRLYDRLDRERKLNKEWRESVDRQMTSLTPFLQILAADYDARHRNVVLVPSKQQDTRSN